MPRYAKVLWADAQVLCPFFVSQDRRVNGITCEGHADGVNNISRFRTIDLMQKQMGTWCCSWKFNRCPVYKMVVEKYAEDW